MAILRILNRLAFPREGRLTFDLPLAAVVLAGLGLAVLAARLGDSGFSPDSWAYFELAKSVFGDEFYRVNTYRSYFSETRSASFPFGYPLLIAAVQQVVGVHPMAAVGINIAAAVGTALLIVSICRREGVPELAQAALVLSLLLYDGYMDEVLFGRSIPLAILCFVGAFRLVLASRHFAAGLLLGAAALVRFDFLVFGILFLAAMPLLTRRRAPELAAAAAGFLLGIAPWVAYSLAYFGKPWVSDNSWIALAAARAYVADYPAAAAATAFDAPGQWLLRVASNIPGLFKFLVSWSFQYPLAVFLGLFAAACWLVRRRRPERKTVLVLAVLLASLFPYALTRYFDNRYFALLFLSLSFFLMLRLRDERLRGMGLPAVAFLALLATLVLGAKSIAGIVHKADLAQEGRALEDRFISSLQACQRARPEIRYIFLGEASRLAPRYGATTGGLAAFIPSNFAGMGEGERQAYLEKMKPYALIDKITETYPCRP
jgi:hypothetical protein